MHIHTDNQRHEYRAFFDRMSEIDLMVRDILLNPVPIEQQDILKKLKILNYALGERNDEYDRMQQNTDN
jgi:hypothetical protein